MKMTEEYIRLRGLKSRLHDAKIPAILTEYSLKIGDVKIIAEKEGVYDVVLQTGGERISFWADEITVEQVNDITVLILWVDGKRAGRINPNASDTTKQEMPNLSLTRGEASIIIQAIVNMRCEMCPCRNQCAKNLDMGIPTVCSSISLKFQKVLNL